MKTKYKVIELATGEEADGVFVLKPPTDRAARIAMWAYYAACDNPFVKQHVRAMLQELEAGNHGEF